MTNNRKVLATPLLLNLAVAAWAAEPEYGRKDVPTGVNESGVVLEVRGVFEAKELEGEFIVLYQDPTKGSYSYVTVEGPTTGEDILELGDVKLAVMFDYTGSLAAVEMSVKGIWSVVPELAAHTIKMLDRPLPDFVQVPQTRLPCEGAVYQHSEWLEGCLADMFSGCSEDGRLIGTFACCDGGVTPTGTDQLDCQDRGVPLPS